MKCIYRFGFFLLSTLAIFICLPEKAFPQTAESWTRKKAAEWYQQYQWLNGVNKISPHASIDKQELARQYHANKVFWDKAFTFIRDNDLSEYKPGIYPIDGENVFIKVTELPSKNLDDTHWEAHRNYVDVQFVLKGKEKMGIGPLAKGEVIQPYDAAKDLTLYKAKGKFYTATPGVFFIFFPSNVHRPGVKEEGFDTVKKVVVKIKALDYKNGN